MDVSFLGLASGQHFSRRHIAFATPIWAAFLGAFIFLGTCVVVIATLGLMPDVDQARLLWLAAGIAAFVVPTAVLPRPAFGSLRAHVVLSAIYLGPMAAMVAFAPHGAAVLGATMFVGPLTAVWVTDRRLIAAHLAAASLALLLPSVLGFVDRGTLFATLRLLPSLWFLGILCTVVLEAAEAQGQELERLARRDPLTGAGNRRLLDERLDEELREHEARGHSLTVLALDLDGFKDVNDRLGHAAGDQLLVEVAAVLQRVVRSYDTVVRQGGDEFLVLLPETDLAGARRVIHAIRAGLSGLSAGPVALSTGIGAATFPADGTRATDLLAAADAALLADKRTDLGRAEPPAVAAAPTSAAPAPAAGPGGAGTGLLGLSRHALAQHQWVWLVTGVMFLINAVLAAALWVRSPELVTGALPWVAGSGVLIAVSVFATRPPRIGTSVNHAVIALGYLTPLATILACQPGGSVGIGSSIFIGPLVAARLVDRRHIFGHLCAATVLFFGIAITGLVDAPTVLGILLLIGSFWLLGACVTVVLEVAEVQGEELEWLVRRDPLTGAANRRHLDEWLARQLARAERSARPLSVVAFDLNGFKRLNDEHGHAAGDRILKAASAALERVTDDSWLVARLGGDEFVLVLPGADTEAAGEAAQRAVRELAAIDACGMPLSTGVGIATAPADGWDAGAVLKVADARLIEHKARSGTSRGRLAPAPRLGPALAD